MKNKFLLLIFSLMLTHTSCTNYITQFVLLNNKSFSVTQPSNVGLYFENDKPDKPYEVIGYVTAYTWHITQNHTQKLADMQEMAAKKGADALLNIKMMGGRDAHLVALAVKWK